MGLAFTIFYLLLAFLSPAILIPWLAPYHIQIVVAGVALLASLPGLLRSGVLRQPTLYCLALFFCTVGISGIANGGFRSGLGSVEEFCSSCIVFVLIAGNCNSIRRVRMITAVVVIIALYFIFRGSVAYWQDTPVAHSPYLLHQGAQANYIPRIRGIGFFNDPNDLAQLIVTCIPLLWLWHKTRHKLHNLFLVYIPLSALVGGTYLTHSRGGLIGLGVLLFLALRKRLGTAPSSLICFILAAVMMFLNFTGGRDISADTGADRMDAWSAGLELARSSPIWGVGYARFPDHYPITAHNSFVLCLAETGLLGYLFWIAIIVGTFLGARAVLNHPAELGPGAEIQDETNGTDFALQRQFSSSTPETFTGDEVRRCLRLAMISLSGFLSAAWFLSRAYTTPLYMILGIATALILLAEVTDQKIEVPAISQVATYTLVIGLLIIAVIYGIIRLHWAGA